MHLEIHIDLENYSFVDRTKEELDDILDKLTEPPYWSQLCDGEMIHLLDSNDRPVGMAWVSK